MTKLSGKKLYFFLEKGICINIPATVLIDTYSCPLLHAGPRSALKEKVLNRSLSHSSHLTQKDCSLLLKHHPCEAKISITAVSSTRHGLSPSCCNNAQKRHQCVPLNNTCIDEKARVLLKISSLRLSQIAQHMTHAPTKAWYLSFCSTPHSQLLNIWLMLNGGGRLKETCINLQINLAFWRSKKRCCIVYSSLKITFNASFPPPPC